MGTFYSNNDYRDYLAHYGVKGMKWGVRKYMGADGKLTPAGKKRAKADGQGFIPRMKIRAQGLASRYAEWGQGILGPTITNVCTMPEIEKHGRIDSLMTSR